MFLASDKKFSGLPVEYTEERQDEQQSGEEECKGGVRSGCLKEDSLHPVLNDP
jgi:hypothetical protein